MSHRAIALATGLALLASLSALAQTGPAPTGTAGPPAREGNIYGHKDHQPTQAEIDRATGTPGVDRPPSDASQVEEDVQKLLQQSDRLDKQLDREERGGDGGAGSQPRH